MTVHPSITEDRITDAPHDHLVGSNDEICDATGWQRHSARGAIAGTIRRKLGHNVASGVDESGSRRYRIIEEAA